MAPTQRSFSLIVYFLFALFFSCTHRIQPVQTTPVVELEHEPEEYIELKSDTVDVDPILIASMLKTPCFGTCPVFEAWVYKNGRVRWCGAENSPMPGNLESTASPDWIEALYNKAEQSGFWELQDQYPGGAWLEDIPMTISYLRLEQKEKRIADQADAPVSLLRFEQWLLQHLMELEWAPPTE
jgi:hypothetical protein